MSTKLLKPTKERLVNFKRKLFSDNHTLAQLIHTTQLFVYYL